MLSSNSEDLEFLQKQTAELIPQGESIFYETPDIGSPLAALVNETLSFHNKRYHHSHVWDIGN